MKVQTVLYVVDSLGLSGKTLTLVNLAQGLDPARYRGVVVSLAPLEGMLADRLHKGGVPVVHVPCADGLQANVVGKLLRLGQKYKPAMVHAFNPRPMLYGGIAAAMTGRPAIGTLSAFACISAHEHHGFLPQRLATTTWRNRLRNRVLGRLLKGVTAVSRRAGESFCNDNAIPPDKLHVIYYGVDIGEIDRVAPDEVARVRAELGARPDDVLVGSVGRLVEQKDYPTQLRALALAVPRARRLRMVVAGAGPLDGELRALAAELGIADRLRWLGERRDVGTVLRALDAFVIASKFEPFGVAVLEAMAARLPIVATEVNELPEILDHGRAGVLVPAEQPEALADALVTIAADPDLRARLGRRARSVAAARYSLASVITQYQRIYDTVTGERSER
ncbi:MAG: glycosyltransferase [Deltaproteobacteria bacterium]|nr:glycosyltransferase [Deltaproteobacteria bacterium]